MKQSKGFLTKEKRHKPIKDDREPTIRDGAHVKHDFKKMIEQQREIELEYDDELDIDYHKLIR